MESEPHPDIITAEFVKRLPSSIDGELLTDRLTRTLYATDASMYEICPSAVFIPRTTEAVRSAVRCALEVGLPVIARGCATSLAGQTVGSGLVIDFSRHLDRILEIDADKKQARVQPGVIHADLNARLRPMGLQFGPDPATSNRATFGGIVANNSTGTHSILYGSAIDHIHSMTVLLADGNEVFLSPLGAEAWQEKQRLPTLEGSIYREIGRLAEERKAAIERDTPRHWRRQGGYRIERFPGETERNLSHLFCGSEGTLGIILEMTVNLVPLPRHTALGVLHFPSRKSALQNVTKILETGPSAIELFDAVGIQRCREVPDFARRLGFVTGNPGALLITEYFAESIEELETRLDTLDTVLSETEVYANTRLTSAEGIKNVWDIRKAGLGLVMGVKGENKPVAFIEDASVPVEHLADYISELEAVFEREATESVVYAHASAGCLHVRPFIHTKSVEGVARMRRIAEQSARLVKKYHGIISSEHGDGQVRAWLGPSFYGPELYDVYRSVKRIFDPDGMFNPGKIVDAPEMTENLRMGPEYRTIDMITQLDFSAEGGFAEAVELCNGAGDCRKLTSGAMCPSFMATRDERHSTRGRANALRSAISGRLPADSFTDRDMYEVMDLCVSCKACKSECPSSVDMARLKFEWLAAYRKKHGSRIRDRIFANLPVAARWVAGPLAPFVNRFTGIRFVRRLLESRLGIAADRPLPQFSSRPFRKLLSFANRKQTDKRVVFFNDTFNSCFHPETAIAAVGVLERFGYSVLVPPGGCCGRPAISKGFIDKARKDAKHTVDRLYPFAEAGIPIVGLEPSCVLSFRDEYPALLPNENKLKAVVEAATTFEEFVVSCLERGELDEVAWKPTHEKILLHGHCHQKALVGMEASVKALSVAYPGRVTLLDTSCCGMAGSFGYESEHTEISRAMAERVLAPSVRSADPKTLIVAAGVSCRAQIEDVAGRKALHPAEVLADALA